MDYREQERIACAHHLGLDPQHIWRVQANYDNRGCFEGLDVVIRIHTSQDQGDWVRKNVKAAEQKEVTDDT